MTAARVIASVEPLLQVAIKHARCVGTDEVRIPIGRAISVMHQLQHLRDTIRREQRPAIRDGERSAQPRRPRHANAAAVDANLAAGSVERALTFHRRSDVDRAGAAPHGGDECLEQPPIDRAAGDIAGEITRRQPAVTPLDGTDLDVHDAGGAAR